MQGVPRCTKALNKSMCILSFDSQMERLAPDARRSGSAAEGSMKKKTSGNEELSVFHCPQHSVLWPNCLTPWFRCLAALCDGDHFWKLLEALLVCFQDSKRTMIVCVWVCSLKAGWVWMGILLFGKEGDSKYLFIQINVSPPLRLKHELKRELTGPMTAERENLAHIRCRFVRTQRVGIR